MHPTNNAPLALSLTNELHDNVSAHVLTFCYSACRLDGHCLGWLPRAAYDQAHTTGRILALWNNDDLVGFCLFSTNLHELRCLQIWIRRDARLMVHGRALIDDLEARAKRAGCFRIRLWCAIDLEANLFWRALHFRPICWRFGRAERGRRHVLWARPITHAIGSPPATVWQPPVERVHTTPWPTLLPTSRAT
jgi:GNAT superfamily N-acetyltransferase